MYFVFVKLAIAIYVIMFLAQSVTKQIFDQLLKARILKYISDKYINMIVNNPEDEWISANYNEKCYKERSIETSEVQEDYDIQIMSDEEGDEDEDMDLLVGAPETLLTKDRLGKILNTIVNDNSSTFVVSIKNIGIVVFIKGLISWGCFSELMMGVGIGVMIHIIDLLINMFFYTKLWYFDTSKNMELGKIINRNNKLSGKTTFVLPLVLAVMMGILRANVYTRVIGEWFMDLRLSYMYVCLLIGYLAIQNYINIIYSCKDNPLMLIMSLIYIGLAFLL
jgi:hypothetical protein